MFTITGLSEFIERDAAAGQTAPETLRRLRHAIVDRQPGQLKDDATAVLVEWHRGAEADLLPRTARQQAVARSVLTNLTTGLRRDERVGDASRLSAAARS